jgi:FkbM family methyltransferase
MTVRAALAPITGWLRKHPAFGRWALRLIPDLPRTMTIHPIGRFRIRLRQHRSYWLRDPLTHERIVLGMLKRAIRPGGVVYDVGANIGLHLRYMAACFGAERIVAFEPMTGNRALLEHNIALGGLADRVTILPLALADHEGDEPLQIDDVRSGSAALNSVTHGRASEGRQQYGLPPLTESVRVRRLDTIMAQENLPAPDVMKIDIEGAELMMLNGSLETLRAHRPHLVVELHSLEIAREVLALLASLGYSTYGYCRVDQADRYEKLTAATPQRLTKRWDLQHIIASVDENLIRNPIEEYRP